MPVYKAPVEDVLFLLNDVFRMERYNNLPGFADATPDLIEAVLGEGAKLCEEVLAPVNRAGDLEGCRRDDDDRVTTPTGFREAYDAFAGQSRRSSCTARRGRRRSICPRWSRAAGPAP